MSTDAGTEAWRGIAAEGDEESLAGSGIDTETDVISRRAGLRLQRQARPACGHHLRARVEREAVSTST